MWLIPALKLNSKSLSNSSLFPNMCWNFAKKCWQSAKCKLSADNLPQLFQKCLKVEKSEFGFTCSQCLLCTFSTRFWTSLSCSSYNHWRHHISNFSGSLVAVGPFTSLFTIIFYTVFSHFILGVARSAFTVELIPPTLGSEEAGLVALTSNIWLEPEFSPGYFLSSVWHGSPMWFRGFYTTTPQQTHKSHHIRFAATLHYRINVALFLLIFAEISCATFISQAQLLFIFKNFECATFIRLRYICFTAW